MRIIYFQAFEYFCFPEEIFRKTLIRELKVLELKNNLMKSKHIFHKKTALEVMTCFIKVEEDIQLFKSRKLTENIVITNKMVMNYVSLFQRARRSILQQKPKMIF